MEKAPAAAPASGASQPEGKTYKEMLRDGNYWLLWLILRSWCSGGMMISVLQHQFLTSINLLGEATLFVMLVSIANTFGRIFWGTVSDKIGRYPTVIAMFGAVATGLLLTALFKGPGSILAILGIMMVALSFGGFLGSFPGITAENWGVTYVGTNYGWMFTAYGVAAIAGPQLGARLAQANQGDYTMASYRYRHGYPWYSTPTVLYG